MMALPKLDVPKFGIKVPGIEKEIMARPFLVKEGNILTQAAEAGDPDSQFTAVEQIIENCTFGEVEVKKLEMYQLQWIFLKIKGKSIGNTQEFILTCGGCEAKINYTMDLDEFEPVGNVDEPTRKIMLTEEAGIVFKRPSAEVMMHGKELSDLELIINCIDYIFDNSEVTKPEELDALELKDFIENMPLHIMEKVQEFLSDTPILGKKIEFTCKSCNNKNIVVINGVEHFFA